ncbi:MAG TPA: MlaD family protein [Burkholderiales bacterium]|nr:MlaD family protein [Burkholderiales bacterium]
MNDEALPRARVRRTRWIRLVWVIPVLALAVTGWLVHERIKERGPEIIISFANGDGLRAGQTPVKYRGVPVGEVVGVALSKDYQRAEVRVRLAKSAEDIAREGAQFWVVRPQVGFGNVTGLGTVLTGPEIMALPGKGNTERAFIGLDAPPVGLGVPGLHIILRAAQPRAIKPNTPVYYRGVEVGLVQKLDLGPNAISADIHVLIWERYAGLVRQGSAFWNISGVNVKGSLFRGIEVDLESVRSLVTGGIEFATPSEKAARVKPGTVFFLHDEPKSEWLNWTARIQIPAAEANASVGATR